MEEREAVTKCANCKEQIVGESFKKGGRHYCCEACAFESTRAKCCDPDRCLYNYGGRHL